MLDSLIVDCWNNGYSHALYMGIQILAFFVQFLSLIFYRKAYGFSLKKAVLTYVVTYPFLFFSIYLITWIENGFINWGANNIVRAYMWAPLLLIPFAKLLRIPYGKICDFFAPSFALAFAVGHIGCIFDGCCYGYPSTWGIYNPMLHQTLFPIQLIECLGAFLVWGFLLLYAKKKNYECRGKVLAMFLILFGGGRFICEFFRYNDKLFWNISELAIWAFLALITGIIMMIIVSRPPKENHDKLSQKEPS